MEPEKEILRKIGQRLTYLRIKKGFTSYEKFAVEYHLSRMQYWKIEKGLANITLRTLINILTIYNLSIEDFFSIKIEEKHPKKKLK